MITVIFYNYFRIAYIRNIKLFLRAILDVLRTIGVWFISNALTWEQFDPWMAVGFSLIVLGNFIHSEVLDIPGITNRWKSDYLKQSFLCVSDKDPGG